MSPTVEERVDQWFDLAPMALSDHGWHVDAATSQGSFSHRPCPWGGQLLRLDFRQIPVPCCTEPTSVQVRPEVRHLLRGQDIQTHEKLLVHVSPGDAVLRGTCEPGAMARACPSDHVQSVRRFVALFGDLGVLWMNNFCETEQEPTARHHLRRNFPETGDATACSHFNSSDSKPEFAMRISRADGLNTFRICLLYSVPVCASAHWVQACLEQMLDVGRKHAVLYLNNPSMAYFRELDKELYVTLRICHFRHGPPLLPHVGPDEPDIRISDDCRLGSWTSCHAASKSKFQAASYIQEFLKRLGHNTRVFDRLDGQKLVPYQCVIRKDEWQKVRGELLQAFRLQKAAYRHAYGGCHAPDLKEDRPAYHRRDRFKQQIRLEHPSKLQLVVRRTFIDIEDRHENESDPDLQLRRSRSMR